MFAVRLAAMCANVVVGDAMFAVHAALAPAEACRGIAEAQASAVACTAVYARRYGTVFWINSIVLQVPLAYVVILELAKHTLEVLIRSAALLSHPPLSPSPLLLATGLCAAAPAFPLALLLLEHAASMFCGLLVASLFEDITHAATVTHLLPLPPLLAAVASPIVAFVNRCRARVLPGRHVSLDSNWICSMVMLTVIEYVFVFPDELAAPPVISGGLVFKMVGMCFIQAVSAFNFSGKSTTTLDELDIILAAERRHAHVLHERLKAVASRSATTFRDKAVVTKLAASFKDVVGRNAALLDNFIAHLEMDAAASTWLQEQVSNRTRPDFSRDELHRLSVDHRPAFSPAVARLAAQVRTDSRQSLEESESSPKVPRSPSSSSDAGGTGGAGGTGAEPASRSPRVARSTSSTGSHSAISEAPSGADEVPQELLDKLNSWGLPLFDLDADQLSATAFLLLEKLGVVPQFCPPSTARAFIQEVRRLMHNNAFHNFRHVVDVLHTVCRFVLLTEHRNLFEPIDLFALAIAALCHDLGHPGVTNNFLISVQHELALRYNDTSVLENHHAALLFEMIASKPSINIFAGLTPSEWQRTRKIILSAIINTDMTKHFDIVAQAERLRRTSSEGSEEDRRQRPPKPSDDNSIILSLFLHAADISNPAKPAEAYAKWTEVLMIEFFNQGDLERALRLQISPGFDRHTTAVELLQVNFIDYIVMPLISALVTLFPELGELVHNLVANRRNLTAVKSEEAAKRLSAEPDALRAERARIAQSQEAFAHAASVLTQKTSAALRRATSDVGGVHGR